MFDFDAVTSIVVSLSGGKDSVACMLWALEHAHSKPLVCHHQAMPEDWIQTIPYCQALCAKLGVPLVVEQAVYIRQPRQLKDGRTVMQRRIQVLDLAGRHAPWARDEMDDSAAICGMVDFANDQGWPPTQARRSCTAYFKDELFNSWVRANRGVSASALEQQPLAGMMDYAADRGYPPTAGTRWCTDKMKTKTYDDAVRRNRHLLGERPVTLLGFRRGESPRRARLPEWRPRDSVCLKPGNPIWPAGWTMVDLHPIIDWSRRQTFRYLHSHGVEPHPAYVLQGMTEREMYDVDEEGGPRCSCRNCIFAHPAHLVRTASYPENQALFAATMEFEARTGLTWQQNRSITQLLQGTERKNDYAQLQIWS